MYEKAPSSQPSSISSAILSSRRSARASEISAAMTRASASPRFRIDSCTAFFTSRVTASAVKVPETARATRMERNSVRFTPSAAIFWSMEGRGGRGRRRIPGASMLPAGTGRSKRGGLATA